MIYNDDIQGLGTKSVETSK